MFYGDGGDEGLGAVPTGHAQTVGPVTDDIGVIRIPKDAPIQIGGYWVLSGADTALGLDSRRGAEIAVPRRMGDPARPRPARRHVEAREGVLERQLVRREIELLRLIGARQTP